MPRPRSESPQERIRRLVDKARQDAMLVGIELASVWVDEPVLRETLRAFAFPADGDGLRVNGIPVRKFEFVRA